MVNDRRGYYLRAEPTPETRELLHGHQTHLHLLCADLRLTPRLTEHSDLHWTVLFLDSPSRWTRVLHAAGVAADVTADDFRAWADDLAIIRLPPAHPRCFDSFFGHRGSAVLVLRLDEIAERAVRETIEHTRDQIRAWERSGRVPSGTAGRLIRHRAFPLWRDRDGGKPHVTLARGRVSKARWRDVQRTLRTAPVNSREPLHFASLLLRTVGSPSSPARLDHDPPAKP